ncbi:hypothetical protein ABZU78_25730 [Rhodococcus erythropolis]
MTTATPKKKPVIRSLAVRKAAAQAAVTASKKTGRPVDARVKKLAESS